MPFRIKSYLYFYDTRSRSSKGMACKKSIEGLVEFIRHLADSLSTNEEDMPFEMLQKAWLRKAPTSDLSSAYKVQEK